MQFLPVWFSSPNYAILASNFIDICLKTTILLCFTAGLAWLLRRQSAALRHLVWSLTLALLAVLPLLSWLLPNWRVLPPWLDLSSATGSQVEQLQDNLQGQQALPMEAVALEGPNGLPAADASVGTRAIPALPIEQTMPGSLSGTPIRQGDRTVPIDRYEGTVFHAASSTSLAFRLLQLFILIWGAGAIVLLARLACSRWRLGRLCSRGTLAPAGQLLEEHSRVCRELGIRRPVTLVLSDSNTIPLAFGVFRARVVLPCTAMGWSSSQRRTVLLHELGHVVRHDPLWQILAQFAVAMHWLNPLVWLAAWRNDVERECACDDLVLNRGVTPQDYARHLLDVVSGGRLRRLYAAMGIAMASSRKLEGRLRSILEPVRSRQPVTRERFAASLLLAISLAAPLAMIRAQEPFGKHSRAQDSERTDQPATETPAVEANQADESPADPSDESDFPFGPINPGLTPEHHTAVIRYDESMLVVANQSGALGIAFEQPADAPGEVRYEFRFVDSLGQESAGNGTLSTTTEEPQPFGLDALQITATFLNSSQGQFDYNPDEVAVTPIKRDYFARMAAPAPGLSATQHIDLSKFLHPDPRAAQAYREHEYQGFRSTPFSTRSDVASFVRYGSNCLVVSTIDGTAAFVFKDTFDRTQNNEHYYGVNYRWRFVSWDGTVTYRGEGTVQEVYVDEQYSIERTTHYLEAGPVHLVWSQGGEEGGWVYHNPAWHAVWFIDHGRGQELLQPETPNTQFLRFAYGRHQPREPGPAAGEEPAAEEAPAAESPAAAGEAPPTKPFRSQEFSHVIQEEDGRMRLVPTTEADRRWIDAVLSWGSNDYDGWRVGALLVNDLDTDQPPQSGSPAAVRYFLQNVSAESRTIRVQLVDRTYPVLGEDGKLNLNMMHGGENIEITALPGEAVSPDGFEIPIDTTEMPDGEYQIYTVSAFSRPNEDGSGGGSPWRVGSVTLTIGQGGQFTAEAQTDEQGIAWGGSVAGLRVGMRMSNQMARQALGSVLQGDMFVWNTTDQAVTFDWDPPAPLDQNQVVYDEQGEYVDLNRVFYTGIRPRNPQSFTLQPGEQVQVGSSLLQSAAEKTQPGPSDPAQLVATSGKFTWQVYLALQLKDLPQFTVIAGCGPVPLEIVAE